MIQEFTLTSNELGGQASIKFVHDGCGGENKSPQLSWSNAPVGTKSFAIDCHDKDAPTPGGFWHWLVYNIPANINELVSGAGTAGTSTDSGNTLCTTESASLLPAGAIQAVNDNGLKEYSGPYPPPGHGWHTYTFTVYALDIENLDLPANLPCGGVGFNIWCHTLAKASITTYYRNL